METSTFEEKLERYAELAVKVGLNLQPGQRLLIVANPLESAPLVRAVATCAYQNGCRLVTVLWGDEALVHPRKSCAAATPNGPPGLS